MINPLDEREFRERIARLELLLAEIEQQAEPAVQDKCREAVQVLLEFHTVGLERLLAALAAAGGPGQAVLEDLARDEVVSTMLVLHHLHPHDLPTRVALALEHVRPLLAAHGGNVELLGITPLGEVHLKLLGSCHGCPSSQATLKNAIEEAIYAVAADVATIHVEGVVAEPQPISASGFVPLSQLAGLAQ